ncbi:MAG: hypothetical protein DRJ42_13410 [Deltaproteobacteria bacterium]|nr:MAG: hypothetical protein DRJ42_13410 [Deltaproteobacteria bacterium]
MTRFWMVLAVVALVTMSTTASADVPEGMTFDDGFTFFELENNRGHRDGNPFDEGWALEGHFRVFGHTSQRSAFKMVIKQGRRTLGETLCEVEVENQHERVADGPEAFHTTNCRDRDQRITQTGDITVELYLIDDDTDQESLLRTFPIHVLTATRVRGNGQPDAPHHYVDRNGEPVSTILHLQPNRGEPYYEPLSSRRLNSYNGRNVVTVTINAHPDRDHWSISSQTHLRCSVDGERVAISDDQVTGTQVRMVYVVHSHGRGRNQEGETEDVGFRQYVVTLPLTFDSSVVQQTHERWYPLAEDRIDERYGVINRHPGQWECQWREERTVLRTWRWTVGDDGKIVPHAEQAAGLSLGPNAFFVETVIPDGGSGYDVRLHRQSVQRNAWYGLGWRTDEGRALAGAVPNVGRPTPPQPRGRGRGGRGGMRRR